MKVSLQTERGLLYSPFVTDSILLARYFPFLSHNRNACDNHKILCFTDYWITGCCKKFDGRKLNPYSIAGTYPGWKQNPEIITQSSSNTRLFYWILKHFLCFFLSVSLVTDSSSFSNCYILTEHPWIWIPPSLRHSFSTSVSLNSSPPLVLSTIAAEASQGLSKQSS